jgi:signal transduction histidine kinase/ActR/RegA family two-component response regulator
MARLRSARVAGTVPEGPVDADEVDRVKLAVEPVLEHLETMATELRESERRNAVLLAMMPDTILIVSNDGTIRSVQPGRGSCGPLQPDGVAGGNLADLEIRAEADIPSMMDRMDDGSNVQSFSILCGSGGSAATLDARMVRLDPESILVVARDVTQKEKAGETATRLQRLESLGLLAGGIAHDFNNRLAAALGSVELAMAKGSPEWGDAVQDLDRAVRAIEGAAELSRRLLTFSSGGDPVMAPVSLQGLAASVLEPVFRGTAVLFSADLPDGLWDLEGDEEQLALLLRNIAVNSLEALGGHGSFTISAANVTDPQMPKPAGGRFVSVVLSDNGSGFSDEALGKAFEPYFSTRADSRGLGLSVCHSIAVKHGGWIDILPGPGARVQVILPAAAGDVSGDLEQAPATAMGGTGRILVMDDDPLVLETVSEMLEALDYSVETSRDGGQAVAMFAEAGRAGRPYDLLILDLVVPGGIGGLETLTRIRQRFGDVAAIVSSGYSSDSVLADHAAHGFRAALRKPFRFDELGSVVARVIARERGGRG